MPLCEIIRGVQEKSKEAYNWSKFPTPIFTTAPRFFFIFPSYFLHNSFISPTSNIFSYIFILPSYFSHFLYFFFTIWVQKEGGEGEGKMNFSKSHQRLWLVEISHRGLWLIGISPTEACDWSGLSVTRTRTEFLEMVPCTIFHIFYHISPYIVPSYFIIFPSHSFHVIEPEPTFWREGDTKIFELGVRFGVRKFSQMWRHHRGRGMGALEFSNQVWGPRFKRDMKHVKILQATRGSILGSKKILSKFQKLSKFEIFKS